MRKVASPGREVGSANLPVRGRTKFNRDPGPKLTTREDALAILKSKGQGWARNHGGKYVRRPKAIRLKIEWRLQYLREKWHHEHPSQQMSLDKLNSLKANAANWALHSHNHINKLGQRFYQIRRAQRFLRNLDLAEFKSKPILTKVKRLPLG